jgi:hypothetical protein
MRVAQRLCQDTRRAMSSPGPEWHIALRNAVFDAAAHNQALWACAGCRSAMQHRSGSKEAEWGVAVRDSILGQGLIRPADTASAASAETDLDAIDVGIGAPQLMG